MVMLSSGLSEEMLRAETARLSRGDHTIHSASPHLRQRYEVAMENMRRDERRDE